MNTALADKLELLAKIVREDLPWQYCLMGGWFTGDRDNIGSIIERELEIRLTPVPQYVPLEAADVPPGSVVRYDPEEGWAVVVSVNSAAVDIVWKAEALPLTWQALFERWQILRPGGQWEPCKKLKRTVPGSEDLFIGRFVRTASGPAGKQSWGKDYPAHLRRWNQEGVITGQSNSHGLCYKVRYDHYGTEDWFNPEELTGIYKP